MGNSSWSINRFSSIATDENNNFIVTWRNHNLTEEALQRFDSFGNPLGDPFIVYSHDQQIQTGKSPVAFDGNNDFIITWHDTHPATGWDVHAYGLKHDSDCDGFIGDLEAALCVEWNNPDTDGDGLCDGNTSSRDGPYLICVAGEDLNLDTAMGIPAGETHPCDPDTDDDNIIDFTEVGYGTDPLNPDDADGDGLTDTEEILFYGSNPHVADTDADGISDFDEAILYLTNPWDQDTDGDGVNDASELWLTDTEDE